MANSLQMENPRSSEVQYKELWGTLHDSSQSVYPKDAEARRSCFDRIDAGQGSCSSSEMIRRVFTKGVGQQAILRYVERVLRKKKNSL